MCCNYCKFRVTALCFTFFWYFLKFVSCYNLHTVFDWQISNMLPLLVYLCTFNWNKTRWPGVETQTSPHLFAGTWAERKCVRGKSQPLAQSLSMSLCQLIFEFKIPEIFLWKTFTEPMLPLLINACIFKELS